MPLTHSLSLSLSLSLSGLEAFNSAPFLLLLLFLAEHAPLTQYAVCTVCALDMYEHTYVHTAPIPTGSPRLGSIFDK